MKKIIIALVTIVVVSVSCKKSAASKVKDQNIEIAKERDLKSENLAIVSFDKVSYDFGTIDEGDTIETSFIITNTGKSDLLISNAKASCGCTIPTWPKEAIKSGESSPMHVKFNSKGKRNKISKTITLTTNSGLGRETVKITGFVTPKAKK
tara:strand:+ start:18439 stop:18891 length:453 start_codon:yes stop_codon:yes gene_type:complete